MKHKQVYAQSRLKCFLLFSQLSRKMMRILKNEFLKVPPRRNILSENYQACIS